MRRFVILIFLFSNTVFSQSGVPYLQFVEINPAAVYVELPAQLELYDSKFRQIHLIGDSTFIISGTVSQLENGYRWSKAFHVAYNSGFSLINSIYSGKTNAEYFEVAATPNYVVDMNTYCTEPESSCVDDSVRLGVKAIDEDLNVEFSQNFYNPNPINFGNWSTWKRLLYSDSSVFGISIGPGFDGNLQLVGFDESTLSIDEISYSVFNFQGLTPVIAGKKDSTYYFVKRNINTDFEVYTLEVFESNNQVASVLLDTLNFSSLIDFLQDEQGNSYLLLANSGSDRLYKIGTDNNLLWKAMVDVPVHPAGEYKLRVNPNSGNIDLFTVTFSNELVGTIVDSETGQVISQEVVYTNPQPGSLFFRPIEVNDELWYYQTRTNNDEPFGFKLLFINDLNDCSVVNLDLPEIDSLNQPFSIEIATPIFKNGTLVVYCFHDKQEEWVDLLPDRYFLAKYDISSALSALKSKSEPQFGLAPNPARHQISLFNLPSEQLQIQVLDLQGRSLFTRASNRQSTLDLPVDQLSPGVYFVSVQGAVGVKTQKFIKH